jgi:hypothetical protein
MPRKLTIVVNPEGKVSTDWWTKEIGTMFCKLCQKCKGWDSGEKPLECTVGVQWCG